MILARLIAVFVLFFGIPALRAQTSMSEYPLKALFLLNFAKYVDWSLAANSSAPIIIDILGQDNFNGSLQNDAAGKSINGRSVVVHHISSLTEVTNGSILFISSSEDSHLSEILQKTSSRPVLTVGENASFISRGGIINFDLKDGKIHLEINLKVAREVKLEISSKLLSVADVVQE